MLLILLDLQVESSQLLTTPMNRVNLLGNKRETGEHLNTEQGEMVGRAVLLLQVLCPHRLSGVVIRMIGVVCQAVFKRLRFFATRKGQGTCKFLEETPRFVNLLSHIISSLLALRNRRRVATSRRLPELPNLDPLFAVQIVHVVQFAHSIASWTLHVVGAAGFL